MGDGIAVAHPGFSPNRECTPSVGTSRYTRFMCERRLARVVRKVSLKQTSSDAAYWRAQPYVERLRALEEIRQEYHRWKQDAESRLQRVYRIVKRG